MGSVSELGLSECGCPTWRAEALFFLLSVQVGSVSPESSDIAGDGGGVDSPQEICLLPCCCGWF